MRDALDGLIVYCPGSGDVNACTILETIERGETTEQPAITLQRTQKPEENGQMKVVQLSVEGMHCDSCARTRAEEHTSELQSLMRNSYAVFCLKKTNKR